MAIGQPCRAQILDDLVAQEDYKASWRTNFFFLFSSSSHIFLWPWIPLILKVSGLTNLQAGIATCLVLASSNLGVHFSLFFLNKTRNGALRRIFLFTTSVVSIFFSISAILIIPTSRERILCPVPEQTNWNSNQISNFTDNLQLNNQTENNGNVSVGSTTNSSVSHLENTSVTSSKISQFETTPNFSKAISTTGPTNVNNFTPDSSTLSNHGTNSTIDLNNVEGSQSLESTMPSTNPIESTPSVPEGNNFNPPTKFPTETSPSQDLSFTPLTPQKTAPNNYDDAYYDLNENGAADSPSLSKFDYDREYYDYGDFSTNIDEKTNSAMSDVEPKGDTENLEQNLIDSKNVKEHLPSKKTKHRKQKESKEPKGHRNSTLPDNEEELSHRVGSKHHHRDHIESPLNREPNLHQQVYYHDFPFNRNTYRPTSHSRRVKRESHVEKSENLDNQIQNNDNTAWGITILLIIAGILGGGIEASISKMWHCFNYVSQEGNGHDILDSAIRPTFRLCTLGKHRRWSLISASLLMTIPTVLAELACHFGAVIYSPFTICGIFHLLTGMFSWAGILFIPIPSGSLTEPKSKYPLSLYLDDEVLKEGLRRVGFHTWAFCSGFLRALPTLYLLWHIEELSRSRQEAFAIQTVAIIGLYFGEGILNLWEDWISRKVSIASLMIASGVLVAIQMAISWSNFDLKVKGGSLLLVGYSCSLMWIASRNNALLLGNSNDQEKEAWVSWICCQAGISFGAVLWASIASSNWSLHQVQELMLPGASLAALISLIIVFVTLIMRTKHQRHRRIYHTLDFNIMNNDEEEELTSPEEEEEEEKDWLVKRAKMEGIVL